MRFANLLMAALFAFGAVVQLNDPDPWAWVAVYLAAAAVCLLAHRRPALVAPPALLGLVCLGWALALAPGVVGRTPFADLFGAWEMANVAVEESREMYGLLLVTGWMLVLAVRALRRRIAPAGGTAPPAPWPVE